MHADGTPETRPQRRTDARRGPARVALVAAAGAVAAVVASVPSAGAGRIAERAVTQARRRPPATTTTAAPTTTAPSGNVPVIGGCPVFPATNPWNTDISAFAVHPRSNAWVSAVSTGNAFLHADFGSDPSYGIPYIVVPATQTPIPVTFTDYPEESDPGPYPIPLNAPIEGGGDRHVIALQQGTCKLYELFDASPGAGRWNASNGAVWNLNTGALRPAGWTSADAAGLPILPGLARHDEISSGRITHALRFTVPATQRGYILPATHWASRSTDPNLPPMGARYRLKASFNVSGYTGHARVILDALKRYGMIVADNGSGWYISGATDARWNDDDLNQLKRVPGSAFEVVDTGPVVTR